MNKLTEAFFKQAFAAFAKAAQILGSIIEYDYALVDTSIRLRFAGNTLIPYVTPAVAHLRSFAHMPPDLTISLWDGRSTDVGIPPLPDLLQTYGQQQNWRFQVEQFYIHFQPNYRMVTLLDKRENQAICWIEDPQKFPWYETAAPFLKLLHWWRGSQHWQIVHAAAVGTAKGGLLLVGKSGSGKSTTALRCLQAGMGYVSDDYCLVAGYSAPTVYSLYNSGKLHFADMDQFPNLQAARSSIPYRAPEKAVYFFHPGFGDQIVHQFPIRALLLPTVTSERQTRLTKVSPAAAMLAVAPSTVFQLPNGGAEGVHYLSQVVRQVPAYRLALGTDPACIPAALCQLLEEK